MTSVGREVVGSHRSHLHAVRSLRNEQTRRASRDASQQLAAHNSAKTVTAITTVQTQKPSSSYRAQPSSQAAQPTTAAASAAAAPIPSIAYTPLEVGLENVGNTCFMNSVLQCLLHTKPLVLYVLSNDCMTDINASSSTKGQVALAFRELTKSLFAAKSGSAVAPSSFRRTLGRWAPHLLDFQQQDSQEFLRFLLDALSNDLCRKTPERRLSIRRKLSWPVRLGLLGGSSRTLFAREPAAPTTPQASQSENQPAQEPQQRQTQQQAQQDPAKSTAPQSQEPSTPSPTQTSTSQSADNAANTEQATASAQQQAEQAWAKFAASNNSVITDLFAGQLESTVECLTCHTKSHCFDPFLDLSLPLPKGNGLRGGRDRRSTFATPSACTLADCFRALVQEEVLEGGNAYMCENCNQKRKAVRRLAVYKAPSVLVVHLKRFSYDIFSREKLETDVQFPLTGLDISPYLSTERRADMPCASYNLIGVCNHMGGMRGGHYTAYVHLSEDAQAQGSWCLFNDRHTSLVPADRVCSQSAYVLFYQRQS